MDQIKIGKFIAKMRREQKLTQKQVAEQLAISDKTISKWETGKGLPEVSCMIPLCNILGINVNELLSGEKLSEENYQRKAEENMMNLIREKNESKKKIILSAVVALLCTSVFIVCVLMAEIVQNIELPLRIFLVVFGIIVFIVGVGVAVVLDRDAGSFECPNCQTRFVPDMGAYIMAPHTITKRKLTCPHCGETHYCKKRMTREYV